MLLVCARQPAIMVFQMVTVRDLHTTQPSLLPNNVNHQIFLQVSPYVNTSQASITPCIY